MIKSTRSTSQESAELKYDPRHETYLANAPVGMLQGEILHPIIVLQHLPCYGLLASRHQTVAQCGQAVHDRENDTLQERYSDDVNCQFPTGFFFGIQECIGWVGRRSSSIWQAWPRELVKRNNRGTCTNTTSEFGHDANRFCGVTSIKLPETRREH